MRAGIEPLLAADIDDAMRLVQAAHWNQVPADWRMMLSIGQGWCVRDGNRLVATTMILPFTSFAWISMVLVLPEHRRRGLASALLDRALETLARLRLTPVLDATPDGQAVYEAMGFAPRWGFSRLRREAAAAAVPITTATDAAGRPSPRVGAGPAATPIDAANWQRIRDRDAEVFGARRDTVLEDLMQRRPQLARMILGAGGAGGARSSDSAGGAPAAGYCLGRDGRTATQLGPLIAQNADIAIALLQDTLPRIGEAVMLDVADHQPALRRWLEAQGFVFQRPFMRMVLGDAPAPGDAAPVMLVAGPELG